MREKKTVHDEFLRNVNDLCRVRLVIALPNDIPVSLTIAQICAQTEIQQTLTWPNIDHFQLKYAGFIVIRIDFFAP